MLMLINQDGRGLCYCYAAYMYYLCRRIGYNPTAISGGYGTKNADHGWIEIKFGGVPYIFDPEICSVRHKTQPEIYQRYTLYKAAYGSTPFPYHK